ncbi:hypothetical protein PSE10B_51590 [Pseudomonas amygdali pv. eriobotryae]|nr:hypothetical protein PSE10B_51590 [Pseudomonas amygdali pv. eriobotryae]
MTAIFRSLRPLKSKAWWPIEIHRNVNYINSLVIQVSAGAEQTAVRSRELARLAEQQQGLVGRFKVS